MPSLDQLEAFVATAERGSFSAAARHLGKVQSTVSNAVINLEIETNIELFDRSSRNPTLTKAGAALLADADNILHSQREFISHATTLASQPETHLCLAIEQSVWNPGLLGVLAEFERRFPYITLELLDPGSSDVGELVRIDRADIGLMIAQEMAPKGFKYQGIGHSKLVTVCHPNHPLVELQPVSQTHLQRYRQLIAHSRNPNDVSYKRRKHAARVWLLESPHVTVELVASGIGWAMLNETVVSNKLSSGELVSLELAFEKSSILQGVDAVWSEIRPLGDAGQWLLEELRDTAWA